MIIMFKHFTLKPKLLTPSTSYKLISAKNTLYSDHGDENDNLTGRKRASKISNVLFPQTAVYWTFTEYKRSPDAISDSIFNNIDNFNNKTVILIKQLHKQDQDRNNILMKSLEHIINHNKILMKFIESIVDLQTVARLLSHYKNDLTIMDYLDCLIMQNNSYFFRKNEAEQQNRSLSNIKTVRELSSYTSSTKTERESEVANNKKQPIIASANNSKDNEINKKANQNSTNVSKSNSSRILILNDENFHSALQRYKLLLVMFYAPWCQYCHDMKPRFYRAAKDLPKDAGSLAMCDGDSSRRTAVKYNVYEFPTLKLFCKGKYIEDYSGPRRSLDLLKFMVSHAEKLSKDNFC